MFSTQTATPAGTKTIAANALRGAGLIDKDTPMRDIGDRQGGRKSSNKTRSHRNRPIDAFKEQRVVQSGTRTLTTPRLSTSDSHAGPSDPLSIRGASRPTLAGRMRRNAVSSSGTSVVPGARPATGRAAKQIELWREVVRARWNGESQFLNLESLIDDEVVKKHNLSPPGVGGGSVREAAVIFKLASELKPPVKTLSLANNRLVGDHLQYLAKYLPKLENLSLQGNNIRQWKDLDFISGRREKLSHIRELVLLDNPIRDQEYSHGRADGYKHQITRRFSSLEMIDSEPVAQISFDVPQSTSAAPVKKPNATTFPVPMGPSMIYGVDGGLVSNFLVRFFDVFDNHRDTLANIYDPQASFSFSVNTTIPARARIQGLLYDKEMPNQRSLTWANWLQAGSRNLNRLQGTLDKSVKSLLMGSDSIVSTVGKLPGTRHDITGPAEKFCLDTSPVPLGTGMGLLVSVHGQFTEMPVNGVRSFDRTFVLAAAPEGSRAKLNGWDVVILSDQWTIRAYSSCDAWKPGPLLVQATKAEPIRNPPVQAPIPVSGSLSNQWLDSLPSEQRNALSTIPEPQRNFVIDVMRRTNLNVKFAVDCLQNNGWTVERALANFEQVKATLGREAYV